MKFFDLIKNRKQISPEVPALAAQVREAEKITDNGERLLQLSALRDVALDMRRKFADGAGVSLILPGLILGVVAAAAVFTVAPPLLIGLLPLIGMSGGLIAGDMLAESTATGGALANLQFSTEHKIEELEKNQNPLSLAASPHFDNLMEKFPKLKQKFILASAKEAALQKQPDQMSVPKLPKHDQKFG